ncbi:hypothetical protein [Atlantibacter sp.]|uniref:hypothetical protein n=1 Tax=Atlantibacter sp. TaxID=1903473 RepID=UPI0028A9F218|nr:hypothetical protein [Atlantibacter sp.]
MDKVQINQVTPYFSVLMGVNKASFTSEKIHTDIINLISKVIYQDGLVSIYPSIQEIAGNAHIRATPYLLKKNPSWTTRSDIFDYENHIVVTVLQKKYVAFYFSEKGLKDTVRDYFKTTYLQGIEAVDIAHLNHLFINEDSIKMIWLLGIHGKNTIKADSKVLGGKSVIDSLDPLEDQSFMMSAVRTEVNNNKSIGLNPFKSSIWKGPCKDWETFEKNAIDILDTLNSNNKNNINPISILASPINDFKNVKNAYDLSIIDPDILGDSYPKTKLDLLRNIRDNFSFEVMDATIGKRISLRIYFENKICGDLTIEPKVKDYEITFSITEQNPTNGQKEKLNTFSRIFNHSDLIKCWYDSGHAIVNGWIFITNYRDVAYNKFFWADFEDYNICQEKPIEADKVNLSLIGKQKSLFCWIKNRWNSKWDSDTPFNTTEKPTGWLYCDDGAGEKADFIHIDVFKKYTTLTLIHVKAAKSSSRTRRISVGAHDVVLSQAVKNLRYANRKNLLHDLKERAENSQNKKCWNNDKEITSSEFIKRLGKIKNSSNNVRVRVVVIQPHTQKSVYESLNTSNIKKQLDVLLVSTDNAIKSSGAEFYIIGHHD